MSEGLDTTLGGAARQFPDTTWQLVNRMHASGDADFRSGLEILCRRYWKPIYHYVRVAWARSNDDAKDLTQAFLMWLLGGDVLKRFDPEKGSFRGYLKVLLKRFLSDQTDAMNALKRGGGVKVVPLEGLEELQPDPAATDPERAFDRAWALSVAKQAVDAVRESLKARGRAKQFAVYEAYDLRPSQEKPTYAKIAEELGMSESDVRNNLFAVRQEIMAQIRKELTRTAGTGGGVEEEYDELFGR